MRWAGQLAKLLNYCTRSFEANINMHRCTQNTFRFGLVATLFVEVLTWTPSDSQQIWLHFQSFWSTSIIFFIFHVSFWFGKAVPSRDPPALICNSFSTCAASPSGLLSIRTKVLLVSSSATLSDTWEFSDFRSQESSKAASFMMLHDASWCLMQEKILSFLAELAERLGLWRLQTIKLCCEWSSRQQCHLFRSNAHQGVTRAHAHTLSQGPKNKNSETHVAWKKLHPTTSYTHWARQNQQWMPSQPLWSSIDLASI